MSSSEDRGSASGRRYWTNDNATITSPIANLVDISTLGSICDSISHGTPNNMMSQTQTSPSIQDSVGTSYIQSFSKSLKTRLTTISTRYKESITKSTRGWTHIPESRVEVRREVDPGATTITNMMGRLGTTKDNRKNMALETNYLAGSSPPPQMNLHSPVSVDHHSTDENPQPPFTANSASN